MKCSACNNPYHSSTGHILSPRTKLCGPCAREFQKWWKGMTRRKWGKVLFYDCTDTSKNKK